MKTIVAFGNPLLDTIVKLEDDSLLKKFNLENDGQKEVDDDTMRTIFNDISTLSKNISAGGCSQNTLRVLQWLTNKQHKAYIFGSVGDDANAQQLKQLLELDGVETIYYQQDKLSTGTTVAFVNGLNRSLVANLGAAEVLPLENVTSDLHSKEVLQNCDIIYVEGFFLTHRKDTAQYVLNFCKSQQKLLAFNLSAEYLCKIETENVLNFIQKADIVFGNLREYLALCKILNIKDLAKIAFDLTQNARNSILKYGKILVVTDGPNEIQCYHSFDQMETFPVQKMKDEEIIDTTGAGDAFVGGFLTGIIQNASLAQSCKNGCLAASNIIKQSGCSLPASKTNFPELL